MAMAMSDLPGELVTEILSRVPLTSLRALRCTCKTWEALSETHIVGKTDSDGTFLGFMVIDYNFCSMKLDLQGTRNNGNMVYIPSIERVWFLEQAEIWEVFHWDGLLLCVIRDETRLLVWNPYLRQLRWIQTRDKLHSAYMYGLGYENNNNNDRNHKILRVLDVTKSSEPGPLFEIYDFNSSSWRVLDVNPGNCVIKSGVSLKGNTYFLAEETWLERFAVESQYILLCFDFTAERFGQRIVLPFEAYVSFSKTVVLSRVRDDEQLAVLHQPEDNNVLEFWITSMIEPNAASWTRFLRMEMTPFSFVTESFFIDEEKKLALVSGFFKLFRHIYKRAYIIREQGCIESVEMRKDREPRNKLVFSSYAPSLVQLQINGRGKRKERDY